jgi:hypothetical protein
MFISRQKTVMRLLVAFGLAFFAPVPLSAVDSAQPSAEFSVVAGNGTSGFSGDGGIAASAQINHPEGIAIDSLGNLYIADTGNHRVRKVTPEGVISTMAGNGTIGFSGDGGPAIYAQLYSPTDVAVDSLGNLYIADFNNHRVRKVTSDGDISTFAGGGANLGDRGPATSAVLVLPKSIAIDSADNLYIDDGWWWLFALKPNDFVKEHVHKVTPQGMISIVAGGGTANPGDGGPATSAQLTESGGISVDSLGNLYITEEYRVRKVTPDGIISTMAGNGTEGYSGDGGPATLAQVSWPLGTAVDSDGNLFITENLNNCIRRVTPNGVISTFQDQLNDPFDIAVDPEGNLFIAERSGNRVLKLEGHTMTTYFPLIAEGAGWSTIFTFVNTGFTEAIAELVLKDHQGEPLIVNGQVIDSQVPTQAPSSASSFEFTIPAGGTLFLPTTLLAADNETRTGWARLKSNGGSLTALATYEYTVGMYTQCRMSVPQSKLLQYASIPADTSALEMKAMAYAIANPGAQAISIEMAFMGQDGTPDADTVTIKLDPGQQIARYLDQDMSGVALKGSLVLSSENGQRFVVIALSEKEGLFTSLPVVPEKAPGVPD